MGGGGGEEVSSDGEGQMLPDSARKRGGWATFPFIAGLSLPLPFLHFFF